VLPESPDPVLPEFPVFPESPELPESPVFPELPVSPVPPETPGSPESPEFPNMTVVGVVSELLVEPHAVRPTEAQRTAQASSTASLFIVTSPAHPPRET
jgi:hypothetical protein